MRASQIKIRDLKTFSDCMDAIEKIESDWRNTLGGWKAWTSGDRTYLTATAEKKIDAINRKADKFDTGE